MQLDSNSIAAVVGTVGVVATAVFAFLSKRKSPVKTKLDEYDWVVSQTKELYKGVADELARAKQDISHANDRLISANDRILKLEELLQQTNKTIHQKDVVIAEKSQEIHDLKEKIKSLEAV